MPSTLILRVARLTPVARARRFPLLALALLGFELLLHAFSGGSAAFALAVLMVAPGLALVPLLPASVRRAPLATVAAVPALGFAATSVLLISLARVGVPIDGWTTRATVAVVCVAGLAWRSRSGEEPAVGSVAEAAALAAALFIGIVLQDRVIGETPLPGNDWAKYVLYADEIRRQGGLLIDNPYWMLGQPFREDPGTPALYGAALVMGGGPAGALVQGIWLYAVMGILAVFALVRSAWGAPAGCLAAVLYAVLPANQDILGWHGLANVAAFPLIALALIFVADALRRREEPEPERWWQHAALGVVLVALAAAHALSATVTFVALIPLVVIAVIAARAGERRRLVAISGTALAAFLVLGSLVLSDLVIRQRTFGGTQNFEAYLGTKIGAPALRDLTYPFVVVAVLAVAALLLRGRADRRLWPFFALSLAAVGLAYSWVLELPLYYSRMVYYLPLALVPLVAVWLGRNRWGVVGGGALATVIAVLAWAQAPNVREFYAFSDRASLRGLDVIAARLKPNDVLVTDRCWSFLTTGLLRTRTLAALADPDIAPAAEVPFARRARSILQGTPAGERDARRLGVRYLLVDPTCVGIDGRPLPAPPVGDVVYFSRRLVVLELPKAP